MKRVLVICEDPWHPPETIRCGLGLLGECGIQFDYVAGDGGTLLEKFSECAAVVLARANLISLADERPWLTPNLADGLRRYLHRGNGLLAIHGGTSRYDQTPGMAEVLGGVLLRHPKPCAVTIEPVADHFVTRGVMPFTVQDEPYWMVMTGNPVTTFLHAHSEHGVQPAGWTRAEGPGRVCVLTPGHYADVWTHPPFQKLLLNALRWTTRLN